MSRIPDVPQYRRFGKPTFDVFVMALSLACDSSFRSCAIEPLCASFSTEGGDPIPRRQLA